MKITILIIFILLIFIKDYGPKQPICNETINYENNNNKININSYYTKN